MTEKEDFDQWDKSTEPTNNYKWVNASEDGHIGDPIDDKLDSGHIIQPNSHMLWDSDERSSEHGVYAHSDGSWDHIALGRGQGDVIDSGETGGHDAAWASYKKGVEENNQNYDEDDEIPYTPDFPANHEEAKSEKGFSLEDLNPPEPSRLTHPPHTQEVDGWPAGTPVTFNSHAPFGPGHEPQGGPSSRDLYGKKGVVKKHLLNGRHIVNVDGMDVHVHKMHLKSDYPETDVMEEKFGPGGPQAHIDKNRNEIPNNYDQLFIPPPEGGPSTRGPKAIPSTPYKPTRQFLNRVGATPNDSDLYDLPNDAPGRVRPQETSGFFGESAIDPDVVNWLVDGDETDRDEPQEDQVTSSFRERTRFGRTSELQQTSITKNDIDRYNKQRAGYQPGDTVWHSPSGLFGTVKQNHGDHTYTVNMKATGEDVSAEDRELAPGVFTPRTRAAGLLYDDYEDDLSQPYNPDARKCEICGESEDAEMAEMYDPADAGTDSSVYCHADCGINRGYEVA